MKNGGACLLNFLPYSFVKNGVHFALCIVRPVETPTQSRGNIDQEIAFLKF